MTIKLKLNGESIDVKDELEKFYNRYYKIIDFTMVYMAMVMIGITAVELFRMVCV